MSALRERLMSNGELDLFEFSRLMWENKVLILGGALVGVLLAFSWLSISTPVYHARVIVGPPAASDIAAVNIGRSKVAGLEPLVASTVYQGYLRALGSEALRQHFFQNVYVPALHPEAAHYLTREYVRFTNSLTVIPVAQEYGGRSVVLFRDVDPQRAMDWVARYIDMAAVFASDGLVKELEGEASLKAQGIERSIHRARINAKRQREDEISRLYEALSIAEALGQECCHSPGESVSGRATLSMAVALPYLRGTLALKAEISALERRISDDPYIQGLRQQQAEMEFYRDLKVQVSGETMYRQDGIAEIVDHAQGVGRSGLLAAGALLGMIMGILTIFIRVNSSA